ncbi:MAG: iron hydrogenase small subunit, partial [Bacilli bacterium]
AFIEFMGCVGGCINGGGQPIVNAKILDSTDVRSLRAAALYKIDSDSKLRSSEKNPSVIELYNDLKSMKDHHIMHKWCHTTYKKRDFYPELD